jgi:hypothetical protein
MTPTTIRFVSRRQNKVEESDNLENLFSAQFVDYNSSKHNNSNYQQSDICRSLSVFHSFDFAPGKIPCLEENGKEP